MKHEGQTAEQIAFCWRGMFLELGRAYMQMQLNGGNTAAANGMPACAGNGMAAQYQYTWQLDTSWSRCSAKREVTLSVFIGVGCTHLRLSLKCPIASI